jgi:CrcB protein
MDFEEHRTLNPQFVLAVAVGGAIGSVARYLVAIGSGKLFGTNFPWGCMIITVTGSFLIGLLVGLFALKWDLPQAVRIFLTVGICGGYTTFSTFSLDAFYLMERGAWPSSLAYMLGSVVYRSGRWHSRSGSREVSRRGHRRLPGWLPAARQAARRLVPKQR